LEMKLVSAGFAWAFVLTLAVGAGGCAKIDTGSFRAPDFTSNLRLPSMDAPVPVEAKRVLTAEDMVDGEGRCASAPLASAEPVAPAAPATPGAPAVPGANADPVTVPANPAATTSGGIALGMSECDVVKRAGPAEKVVINSNAGAERSVVLTYVHSMRPGTYNFVGGRLVSIERVEEPPPPPKPAKPAKSAKPKPKPKPDPT
jgi:hypothetical protein